MTAWLLPEHVEDVLPPEAQAIERLRRILLDRFQRAGYQLVIPPLIEHAESLLTGTGKDLDSATFKLIDQLSGRMLGVRADHTPQVTRIDAQALGRRGVARLCYCGSVLHSRPQGLTKSREPIQIGAELYGYAGIEADIEIQRLLVSALRQAGISALQLDVGHPGVFRALVRHFAITAPIAEQLAGAVTARDVPRVKSMLATSAPAATNAFVAMTTIAGEPSRIKDVRAVLKGVAAAEEAVTQVETVLAALADGGAALSFDFAELGGFDYESGLSFAAFVAGVPDAIARGGRYDEVGAAFGRARPATGFTLDIKLLAPLLPAIADADPVFAPWANGNAELRKAIEALRASGETVIELLPGERPEDGVTTGARALVQQSTGWVVEQRSAKPN